MKQEIEDKIKEYSRKNSRISEETYTSWYNNDRMVKHGYLSCPCGRDRLQFVEIHIDENNNVQGDYHVQELAWKLYSHIERKVRLNQDQKHVEILIELIGKEEALCLISRWAKKNIIVASALLKYVEMIKQEKILING